MLGFSFGWLFFQAFAMKDMAGGDYLKSLRMTFIPEFLSMNILMAGMTIVSKFWMAEVPGSTDPANAAFWFIMSMALIAGFMCAYPMNWWLVTRHLKHGMMTVRKDSPAPHTGHDMASMGQGEHANHDMHHDINHDINHDMNRSPSLGTILAWRLEPSPWQFWPGPW